MKLLQYTITTNKLTRRMDLFFLHINECCNLSLKVAVIGYLLNALLIWLTKMLK